MITIETEARIAATRERVWAVLTDYAGYARWNPYLVAVEGEARGGALLTVTSVPAPGAPAMTAPVDVVSVEPFTMRWEGGMPDRARFRGDHWWVLEAEGDATRLRHFEHFTGSEAAAILGAYGDRIRANFNIFNAALKAAAEHP